MYTFFFSYKLAKMRDLNQMKCIKDEESKEVTEQDIKEIWKSYFHELFHEGYRPLLKSNRLNTREEGQNYTFYCRIREFEVKKVLKQTKNGKAVGLDKIPIKVWKCLGEKGISWLTMLFNEILISRKMSNE